MDPGTRPPGLRPSPCSALCLSSSPGRWGMGVINTACPMGSWDPRSESVGHMGGFMAHTRDFL